MITINLTLVLSMVSALFGCGAAVVAVLAARSNQRWQERCLSVEVSLAAIRREMEHVASISVRTGRRVKRIENEYSGVADRVDQVELRGPTQSFEQAIDSARRGADPVKLSQQFGLSRGEADLVLRMHGKRVAARAG
jgi:Protein of unknown function (DUF2802)